MVAQKVTDKGIGLARGCAVADGDGADVVFRDECGEGIGGTAGSGLRGMEIEDGVGEELAGLIDDSNLTAGAQAGVDAEHRDWAGGCGEQEVLEVVAEDLDGVGVGAFLQLATNLALDRRIQQALPCIVD